MTEIELLMVISVLHLFSGFSFVVISGIEGHTPEDYTLLTWVWVLPAMVIFFLPIAGLAYVIENIKPLFLKEKR